MLAFLWCALTLLALFQRGANVFALDLEIVTWDSPPYVHHDDTFQTSPTLRNGLLDSILAVAKYGCKVSNVSFATKLKDYATFISHVDNISREADASDTIKIFLPAYQNSIFSRPYAFGHVGIVNSPGMTLVGNSFFKSMLYQLVFIGFKNARMFLITMVLFMIDIGIIIWICVSLLVCLFLSFHAQPAGKNSRFLEPNFMTNCSEKYFLRGIA